MVRGNYRHVFGFVGVGEAPDRLLTELERIFDTLFTKSTPDPKFPGSLSESNTYMDRERNLWVLPNHAVWRDTEYPEHPECDWLLECDIGKDDTERVAALLAEHLSHLVVLLHQPRWIFQREEE